jgi:DNA-binding XRE family transcriptional regulator
VKQPASLREFRENAGLTQQQLADAVGVHVQYISAIERGARKPGMVVATRIRDFSRGLVSLDMLVPPAPRPADGLAA